jgi:cytochrome c oxidase subunit 1
MIYNLVKSIKGGTLVTDKNVWGGETLEWTIETPPIHENFSEIPVVETDPYQYKINEPDYQKVEDN